MNTRDEMNFERLIRTFRGEKGNMTAGEVNNLSSFKAELRKCVPNIIKKVRRLDTTTHHKEILMNRALCLRDLLKGKRENGREIIICLFYLISRLLGINKLEGHDTSPEPFFYQTLDSCLLEQAKRPEQDFFELETKHRENVYLLQKQTFTFLKEKKLSDQVIAGVLNISEREIKKLKRGI